MYIRTRFTLLLFIVVTASFFPGCKKDPAPLTGGTGNNVKSQITTSLTGLPDTVTYAYDSTGRQIRSQTDTLVTTYTYTASSVTMDYMLAGDNFTTIYATNTAGLATSDSKGDVYVYDNNGYLVSQSYTGTGNYDSTVYRISGGDVDTSVQHQANAVTNNYITTSYTYLSAKDNRNFGLAFLGKPNTNLINTETITQVNNGSSYSETYTYSYTFDGQGRVTQQVQTNGSATYTTVYTY